MSDVRIEPLSEATAAGFLDVAGAGLSEYGVLEAALDDGDLQAPLRAYEAAWVALSDGVVAGTVALRRRDDGDLHLVRMFVSPALRGRGVGGLLLDVALAHARATDAAAVHLETLAVMHAAHHLYERAGFERTGSGTFGGNCDVLYTLHLR